MPNDVYSNGHQQQVLHRASDPLDLLQFHRNVGAANELPMHNLTKPVHDTAWNAQLRSLQQQPHFGQSTCEDSSMVEIGAGTEPMPNQDIYRLSPHESSEVSDSAYESMPTSGGAPEAYNTDGNELMGGYLVTDFRRSPVAPSAKMDPPRVVRSEGQFLTPSSKSRRKQYVGPCPFPGCNKQPKNQSDAKYVC